MRLLGPFSFAVFIMLALFWLMQWMIAPPADPPLLERKIEGVEIVKVEPPDDQSPDEFTPESAPPPPPGAPPPLARPDLPSIPAPAVAAVSTDVAVPLKLAGGATITGSGFGGFASGSGAGGDGFGRGKGFKGKELVPLSTARPQMPKWACEKKLKGWVEAVFTVMPNGRVQDVKIIDAEPKGVYEGAAVESIGNWIYEGTGRAREVKQRVPMDPADCAYNWQ